MSRYLLPAFALLLIVLVVLSLGGPEPTSGTTDAGPQPPRYTLRGAQWQRYDEQGQLEFTGRADTIDYYDDESARLTQFEVSMLGGSGAPWIARAPAGEVPAGDPRLHLTGGVEGEGRWPDGEALRFRTPELWLDSAKDRLETEAGFELDSPSRSARGGRLAVEGKRQQLVLRNDVTMRYATP